MRLHIIFLLILLPNIGWQGEEKLALSQSDAVGIVDSVASLYTQLPLACYPRLTVITSERDESQLFDPKAIGNFPRQSTRLERYLTCFNEDSLPFDRWLDMEILLSDISYKRMLVEEMAAFERYPSVYVDYCLNIALDVLGNKTLGYEQAKNRINMITKIIEGALSNVKQPAGVSCRIADRKVIQLNSFLQAISKSHNPDPSSAEVLRANLKEFHAFCQINAQSAEATGVGSEDFEKILHQRYFIKESKEQLEQYALGMIQNLKKAKALVLASMDERPSDNSCDQIKSPEDLRSALNRIRLLLVENQLIDDPGEPDLIVINAECKTSELYSLSKVDQSNRNPRLILINCVELNQESKPETMTFSQRSLDIFRVYLQEAFLTRIAENPSIARRSIFIPAALDGWLFYWDDILLKSNYLTKSEQIDVIDDMILGGVKSLADIRMHSGEISLHDVVGLISKETGIETQEAMEIALEIAIDPGHWIASLVWWRQAMRALDEAKRIKGDEFTLRQFNNCLIMCGCLPPGLLKECVGFEIIRQ